MSAPAATTADSAEEKSASAKRSKHILKEEENDAGEDEGKLTKKKKKSAGENKDKEEEEEEDTEKGATSKGNVAGREKRKRKPVMLRDFVMESEGGQVGRVKAKREKGENEESDFDEDEPLLPASLLTSDAPTPNARTVSSSPALQPSTPPQPHRPSTPSSNKKQV